MLTLKFEYNQCIKSLPSIFPHLGMGINFKNEGKTKVYVSFFIMRKLGTLVFREKKVGLNNKYNEYKIKYIVLELGLQNYHYSRSLTIVC